MDRLQSMRTFQEVVDAGGFAAAARKLDLSPAAVTRLVSDLETALGARLLQRSTRRLSLTQAGEAYLGRVRGILSEIDDANAMVQAQTRQMQGGIRVASTTTVAAHVLAPAIASFQRVHPLVTFELVAAEAPAALLEEVDLALVSGTGQLGADVITRTIFTSQTVVCASPEYLRVHGEPAGVEELGKHRWLRLRMEHHGQERLQLTDPRDGTVSAELRVTPVLLATGREPLLRATLDGAGLCIQPLELIAPMLRNGTLRRVLAPWMCEKKPLVAALPSRQYMPERVRAFLDHVIEQACRQVAGLGVEDLATAPSP